MTKVSKNSIFFLPLTSTGSSSLLLNKMVSSNTDRQKCDFSAREGKYSKWKIFKSFDDDICDVTQRRKRKQGFADALRSLSTKSATHARSLRNTTKKLQHAHNCTSTLVHVGGILACNDSSEQNDRSEASHMSSVCRQIFFYVFLRCLVLLFLTENFDIRNQEEECIKKGLERVKQRYAQVFLKLQIAAT